MELLNSIGLTIIAFVFVLGVMIFVHELGHYLMAKYLGIRVEVFSLGFGPRLFGFRRGPTDYRVSAIPLGGFVKMAGENYDEALTGEPDEFLSRPKLQRFWVAVAGPLMNLGLAVVLLSVNYMVGIQVPAYLYKPAVIGKIEAGSPAAQAGLKLGDKIVAINGKETPTWQSMDFEIGTNPNVALNLAIEREGKRLETKVVTSTTRRMEVGTIGVGPFIPYLISQVTPGSPAEQAGLQPGDRIIQVKSRDQVAFWFYDIPELISSRKGEPLDFQVERNSQVFSKTIVPIDMEGKVRIGIEVEPSFTEKYSFFKAVAKSARQNYEMTLLTFNIVGKIITGRTSLRSMSGPIEIARFSGEAASLGILHLMRLMALISLQLGIFNLLPIPILDGGVIALLALEGLIRRDLSLAAKERIAQIGFIFLIVLMGIVLFNDLSKNLPILE